MFIAKDINQFKSLFVNQLKSMLSADAPGAFILVLANSQQDAFLKDELHTDLTTVFSELKNKFNAGKLNAAPDDMDVFKRLLDVELEDIPLWSYKSTGVWQVAYNAMRELRPTRASSKSLSSIRLAYDESGFHFNKPFLKPEILWQGTYNDINLRVLYNKFPFSDYHLLLVASPEEKNAQLLTREMHCAVLSLTQSVADSLPGFGAAYNSLAAGASVNHMHFQGFVRESLFPIENKQWKHNGGALEYPLTVWRFDDADDAWLSLSELIGRDIAFNCLYRGSSCYVMPRKYQGSVELPGWLMAAGWLDVAGVMTVSDEATFNAIDSNAIQQSLALMSV